MAVTQGTLARYNAVPGGFRRWEWHIRTAVSPAQLSFALGPYVHFVQDYQRGTQSFPLNYYALSDNKSAAKNNFAKLKVPRMLDCLERYLGPYPFPRAGYAFIETPSPSQGLPGLIPFNRESFETDFSPALLRETARQWLGHRIQFEDEEAKALGAGLRGFMQVLHLDCRFGQDSAYAWLQNLQQATNASNQAYRDLALGVWGWQNLRYQVNNDSLFLGTISLLVSRFANKSIKGSDLLAFLDEKLAIQASPILLQYIIRKEVPILEYAWKKRGKRYMLRYHWVGTPDDFTMSLRFLLKTREERVQSGTELYEVDMTARDRENLKFDLEKAWYILKEAKKL
jgi:aminopeptidase N